MPGNRSARRIAPLKSGMKKGGGGTVLCLTASTNAVRNGGPGKGVPTVPLGIGDRQPSAEKKGIAAKKSSIGLNSSR